jgi:phytoene synthase
VTIHALVVGSHAQLARATIAKHSKSFALASRLLDPQTRDRTAVLYAWCRRADDAIDGDLPRDATDKAQIVRRLEDELGAVYARRPAEPLLHAFGEVACARGIPRAYPMELLAGMAMDANGTRYATMRELRLYCWRVAGVVGLMMTHVFGIDDDAALVHAAHLGMGMQLTNICRDVEEDWRRGRLYIPDELLTRYGAGGLAGDVETTSDIPLSAREPLAGSVRELLAIADRYYASGDRGLRALPWRAAIAVKAASNVYRAIGTRLLARDCDVTAGRAVVSKPRKLGGVLAAALRVAVMRTARRARTPLRILEHGDVPEP